MTDNDFYVFGAILGIAAVAGLIANRLHQPVIIAFIAVGILVGPVGTGWVTGDDQVDLLAHLGIAVLLFLVGLKLDLHLIRTTGPVALATGLGQVTFTSVVGFGIAIALGFDATTALYIAVALTFSSTIIIVKLLSDKRELEQLHGRIAVGFLIVQDIVVVLVMIGLTAFGQETDGDLTSEIALVVGKGVALLGGIALLMKFVLPGLLHLVARSSELLVLFAVAWAVSVASFSDWLGFSTEVGAFLAGISLASTPYREAVGARLVSLRDFLLLFFFLDLGAKLEFADAGRQLVEAGIFSAFVLIGNPIIVLIIMGLMGYSARTGFLAGLTVAQISEFSLILAALGLSLGHIDSSTVSLITVVGLITIGISTYLILYSHPLYERLKPALSRFQRADHQSDHLPSDEETVEVVLYGLGRYGGSLARSLTDAGHSVLGVDFDPQAVAAWNAEGIVATFGDSEDLEMLDALPIHEARWVISTIPDPDVSVALAHGLRNLGYQGRLAVTAHDDAQAQRLAKASPDLVLRPFSDAAERVVAHLKNADDPDDRGTDVGDAERVGLTGPAAARDDDRDDDDRDDDDRDDDAGDGVAVSSRRPG
jgi:Kef-type K+ transport system membrane component KefB